MTHMPGIIKLLKENTGAMRLSDVFSDFVHLGALSYRNSVDLNGWQKREDEYLRIIGNYTSDQAHRFAEILCLFTLEMTQEPRDILGELYMRLELGSKDIGQCFTPWNVSQLMSDLLDDSIATDAIAKRGYVTVSEPACGAGAMAIATVEHLRKNGINPQRQAHIVAEDVNGTAVHMAYMQLSILGIPAVVHHRNTLTRETFASWPTPAHIIGRWNYRLNEKHATESARALESV
ncbi:N-6 DNA methylase [Glutamicibacter ardleyensis]|uniref:N-6 DNA methylase n=1 Tax=Glutamicibacter ardleyensis TaxID=225894 RepID=UPI003FD39EEB